MVKEQATPSQKILILAAIPHGLRLDKEIREIDECIRRAVRRDIFEVDIRTAVRPQDIRRAIAEEKPQIVHFCGHGLEDGSLLLENDGGQNKAVAPSGLASLFELHADYVNCVLLNACHSAKSAEAISEYINYAIGMNQEIQDKSAIQFAQGFYDGLGYVTPENQDVFQRAFQEGKVAIKLENLSQAQIPVFKTRTNIDKPHTVNFGTAQRVDKPFQAPPLPTYYVDRPEYSQDLKTRLLTESNDVRTLVVTAIHGLGSVGKSTLATALAHDPKVKTYFCDGILWVTLGQEPNLLSLLSGWVQTLGDYSFKATSVEAASNQLRTLLYDKAVMLVVDDAWNTQDAQAFNVGGPRCQVLVTTREVGIAQVLGASTYSLDVMQPSQAMELLTKKLGRNLTDIETQSAEVLARELGYLPLALELAAAQVAGGTSWTVLVQDMQQKIARLKTFDNKSARDAADEASLKKLSLTASLNLSVQRLSNETRENFIWLGILPEDVTITGQMIATLWDMDDERDAEDELGYLHSKALLLSGVPLIDGTPTYRLHDLFHDLAGNLLTAPPKPKRKGNLPGLGITLADAHATFLEKYRNKTSKNLWHTLPNDGYIHQHLVWHLEKAEKVEEIHELLREESKTRGNGWYEACDRLGQTGSFVTDVARAWRLAEEMFEENPKQSIALQCHYALIITSLNSLAKNIPAGLMAELVKHKLWNPAQGLAYAQQVKDNHQRVEALSALAPHLSKSLLSIALDSVRSIQHDLYCAEALSKLAPHLPPELLQEALDSARSFKNDSDRTQALRGLAGYLPPELLQEALDSVRSFKNDSDRAQALNGLAPHLPGILQEALEAARGIKKDSDRALALSELAQYLPEILHEALDTIHGLQSNSDRASALFELPLHLPRILQEAFNAALSIKHDYYGGHAISKLAPYLPPELLQEAFDAVRSIQTDWCRASHLSDLVAHLPPDLLQQAFDVALSLQGDSCRGTLLGGLMPHLPPELLQEALDAARTIESGSFRALALSGLASHLPELVQEALDAARSIQDDYSRALALSGLASHLPGILQEALDAARSIQDDYSRALALSELVPHLPEILQETLDAARSIQNNYSRASALGGIAPHLPEILQEALDAACSVECSIRDDYERASALKKLAPHLRPDLVQQAFENARSIQTIWCRTNALSGLVPRLPPELLKEAVDDARSIQDDYSRALALAGLAPQLPELVQEALDTAHRIQGFREDYERANVLVKLAPHQSEILQEALDLACSILNDLYSGTPLSELAPHLPPELLPQALDAVRSIKNDSDRAKSFSSLLLLPNLDLSKFDFWCEILHNLSHNERDALLQDIPKLSNFIIALGGTEALVATVRAIQQVCKQWW